jgi:hypothetical protein
MPYFEELRNFRGTSRPIHSVKFKTVISELILTAQVPIFWALLSYAEYCPILLTSVLGYPPSPRPQNKRKCHVVGETNNTHCHTLIKTWHAFLSHAASVFVLLISLICIQKYCQINIVPGFNLRFKTAYCEIFDITRWFKYDRDKLWLVDTQISPGHIWTTLYMKMKTINNIPIKQVLYISEKKTRTLIFFIKA